MFFYERRGRRALRGRRGPHHLPRDGAAAGQPGCGTRAAPTLSEENLRFVICFEGKLMPFNH